MEAFGVILKAKLDTAAIRAGVRSDNVRPACLMWPGIGLLASCAAAPSARPAASAATIGGERCIFGSDRGRREGLR